MKTTKYECLNPLHRRGKKQKIIVFEHIAGPVGCPRCGSTEFLKPQIANFEGVQSESEGLSATGLPQKSDSSPRA